jgi:hypothetical protein
VISGAAATNATFKLNKPVATQQNIIYGQTAGSTRWTITLGNSTAEGGSNAGSDFALNRYSDASGIIDSPISIIRSTGQVTFNQAASASGPTINAAASQNATLAINKPASALRNILFGRTNGVSRWAMDLGDATAESANTGSDFGITPYNDAGTALATALKINRSTFQINMSGSLVLGGGALVVAPSAAGSTAAMYLTKNASAQASQITGQNGANNRWIMSLGDTTAEGGSNAGSNFVLTSFTDASAFIANPLSIVRSSGIATFSAPIVNGSDAELKENVSTIPDALAKVLGLNGVTYNQLGTDRKDIGLIAQEVQSVVPEVVFTVPSPTEPGKEVLGIAYSQLVGLLVNAIKELNDKVATLEGKLPPAVRGAR